MRIKWSNRVILCVQKRWAAKQLVYFNDGSKRLEVSITFFFLLAATQEESIYIAIDSDSRPFFDAGPKPCIAWKDT